MKQWSHYPLNYSKDEVKDYCKEAEWQRIRLSLKGLSTELKLDRLSAYAMKHHTDLNRVPRKIRVQIDNYINALKRGGLLDTATLRVKR